MIKCPICKSDAEIIEPGMFDGNTFRCPNPNHKEFDVAHSVLRSSSLMDKSPVQWENALSRAALREGARPRITTYDF